MGERICLHGKDVRKALGITPNNDDKVPYCRMYCGCCINSNHTYMEKIQRSNKKYDSQDPTPIINTKIIHQESK